MIISIKTREGPQTPGTAIEIPNARERFVMIDDDQHVPIFDVLTVSSKTNNISLCLAFLVRNGENDDIWPV